MGTDNRVTPPIPLSVAKLLLKHFDHCHWLHNTPVCIIIKTVMENLLNYLQFHPASRFDYVLSSRL